MQKATPLSLSAAAWFFVGQGDEKGVSRNVEIKSPFRVGRSPDCELTLSNRSVSGFHAKIVDEDGGLWLHDEASTNGTFVNGMRITDKILLKDGDTVQFAAVVFQVTNESNDSLEPEIRTPQDIESSSVDSMQSLQLERLFNGGVVPFFQPIVRLTHGGQSVAGMEVLGRSRIFGLRTPAQMFAVASRLEMEVELSRVLRRQGIELAQDSLPEHIALFVNTHPAELHCEGLIQSLHEARETCPGRPITVEVCESVLNDVDKIIYLRSALEDMDIKLAFDNFGAGQSRLFALSEVTPDLIKFDHKLIQGIHKASTKRQHFVAALVKMIVELGITPLAECVEDEKEHETLQQLGFQLGQGFFYGKPASLPDCVQWLRNNSNAFSEAPRNEPLTKSFLEERPSQSVGQVYKDADWLLEQPANHYTVQVLSAISEDRAQDHVARQENPQDFAIFCKPGKTRMLYIVVYGVFADRDSAKEATRELESVAVSPWIRLLSGVHNEIRGNHQL